MRRLSLAMMGLAIAGLVTMVSCRKPVNQFNTTGEKITFSATTENNSKTYAEEVGGDMYVKWSEGDVISVNGNVFTLEGEGGETSGSFTGNIAEATGYFASYPATNDGSSVTFTVPAPQDNGTDLNGKIPMVAYTTEKGGNLEFKNMVNILQLNLTGTQIINTIEVESTEENLSGDFTVNSSLVPTAINAGTITKKITITKDMTLSPTAQTVYVVLPVFSSADSKVTVKFTGTDGEMTGSFKLKGSEPGSYATTPNHRYTMDVAVSLVEPVETDEWINFNDATMGVTGLPKWAKKSIGATCSTENPTDPKTAATWYGGYYAWGEVAPYATTINWTSATSGSVTEWCAYPSHNSGITFDNSVGYAWKNYLDGQQTSWSASYEWNPTPYDGKTKVLNSGSDAAHAVLGGSWRMPTSGEWKLLKDNTYFQWTTDYMSISGLNGYIVYKVKDSSQKGCWTYYENSTWNTKNASGTVKSGYAGQQNPFGYTASDPHMFLPAAGIFVGKSLDNAGSRGCYWSSSLHSSSNDYAWYMVFYSSSINPQSASYRRIGYMVRPVQ